MVASGAGERLPPNGQQDSGLGYRRWLLVINTISPVCCVKTQPLPFYNFGVYPKPAREVTKRFVLRGSDRFGARNGFDIVASPVSARSGCLVGHLKLSRQNQMLTALTTVCRSQMRTRFLRVSVIKSRLSPPE